MENRQINKHYPASKGRVEWSCPSNIAIVKYWGKRPVQLPRNPSLSLTLKKALSLTRIDYEYSPSTTAGKITFSFEGKEQESFNSRINEYIARICAYLPWLKNTTLLISSKNTFPHSAGIASSASAMGALASCLVEMDEKITGKSLENPARTASFLARIGSGSASRSLFPGFALWGQTDIRPDSSDEYAIPLEGIHDTFQGMFDSILIVEPGQKLISSSAGHKLMENHPYAPVRFKQASENVRILIQILKEGSWMDFIELMEEEALTLHAMMLSSKPGYILMLPNTLEIIRKIRAFRLETKLHLGFTLDAGPNVHLIYDKKHARQLKKFIESDLIQHCKYKQVIHDEMGSGPANPA